MSAEIRRQRLEQLLALAQTYQGWNRKQLARALGRDTTRLVPQSGLPKLDLLMVLAGVLDWPLEDVAGHLWNVDVETVPGATPEAAGFDALASDSLDAHRAGRYTEAVEFARAAHEAADSAEERAIAANREASAWDGLGRYTRVLEAAQRGLREHGVSKDRRLTLQANLGTAYYAVWQLTEAAALSQMLVARYVVVPPVNRLNRVVHAFAYYLRGHTSRRLIAIEPDQADAHARSAKHDLLASQQLYHELADEFDDDAYAGIANTCRGGVMEAEVVLGERTPEWALDAYEDALGDLIDPEQCEAGDWLESYGWWCIFGCNVALRHLSDDRRQQRAMALFTNKAEEIAKRLGNWAIRERVFTLEYARRQRFADWTGLDADWTIDLDDLRVLAGTMGRFPAFQPTGWRILESTKVVYDG